MHPLAALTTLLLALTTLLHPAAATLNEKRPYLLSNISYFAPTSGASAQGLAGYVTFLFTDTNKGLKLKTQCTRVAPPGTSISDGVYYPCLNNTVGFAFKRGGAVVEMQRSYQDPSVGNPDIVTAFGHARTNFSSTPVADGTVKTAPLVKVAVTSLIARQV